MNKQEFLARLKAGLGGLPTEEIEQRISFYGEIIDDKIEEGLSETEAVSSLGGVDKVIEGILEEIPLTVIVKKRIKPKNPLKGWEIGLIIAGSPIWGSILIALLAVAFSVYASLWAALISVWAMTLSFAVGSIAGIVMLFVGLFTKNAPMGFAMLGAGLFLGGLAIFSYALSELFIKALVKITVKIPTWIKRCFIGRENKNEQN